MLLRMLISIAICLVLLPAGTGLAHDVKARGIVYVQTIQVGPYTVDMGFNEYPIPAKKSLQVFVEPIDGYPGKKATYRLIPPAGVAEKFYQRNLLPYPGIDDAWVLQHPGLPYEGQWTWEIEIDGPKGKATGRLPQFKVLPPPGIPYWTGWVIGIFPLYGLLWFAYYERKRVKRLIEQDNGARV
ncbi:hypothetical protein [Brevibacillus dissolubilis]|uniref:hypothetical protein n=1 Tax=Brevibacillus dissolubilis TaxID=1844116 RepID=UPI0011161231|nr:hypothetical protein [Brevibacillus dissolubilis]